MTKRVLIAMFMHETNTFSILPTDRAAYQSRSLLLGDDIARKYAGTKTEVAAFLDGAERHGWQAIPIIAADATPSGMLTRDVYEYMYQTLRIPPYDDEGNYICITTQQGIRGLHEDPDYEATQVHADPKARLNGEVDYYHHFRIVRTNHPQALGTVGAGGVCAETVFFGEDAVMKAVAAEPIILADKSGDFGRSLVHDALLHFRGGLHGAGNLAHKGNLGKKQIDGHDVLPHNVLLYQ